MLDIDVLYFNQWVDYDDDRIMTWVSLARVNHFEILLPSLMPRISMSLVAHTNCNWKAPFRLCATMWFQ